MAVLLAPIPKKLPCTTVPRASVMRSPSCLLPLTTL